MVPNCATHHIFLRLTFSIYEHPYSFILLMKTVVFDVPEHLLPLIDGDKSSFSQLTSSETYTLSFMAFTE